MIDSLIGWAVIALIIAGLIFAQVHHSPERRADREAIKRCQERQARAERDARAQALIMRAAGQG